MKYRLESAHPVGDAAAKAATGKTLAQWYSALDGLGGRKLGRAAVNKYLLGQKVDLWWCTTIAVEYERHLDVRKKDGRHEGYFVCVTKTIAAPLATVFAAWVDGRQLSRWFGDETKAEAREGGRYANADGDQGSFLRVRRDKDLRLTFENPAFSAPTLVDVQFQDKGKGRTGVTLNHTRIQTRAEADGLRKAWADALDRLQALGER